MNLIPNALTMSSREIADLVGARHNDVIATIERLFEKGLLRSSRKSRAVATGGRPLEVYDLIERDTYLVTAGYSDEMRARIIDRWQELERAAAKPTLTDRQTARLQGKEVRRELTDTVAEFVNYATAQGSKSAHMYYMSITKMEYKALFMVFAAVGSGFRDTLTAIQNSQLATAERVAQLELQRGMAEGLHYKDIYQNAKRKVEALVAVIGTSLPGDDRPMLGA